VLGALLLWTIINWGKVRLDTLQAEQESVKGILLLMWLLVIFAGYGYVGSPLQPVEPWREDGRAVFRFEQEHPDMIAVIKGAESFTESPMTPNYASEEYQEDYTESGILDRLAVIEGRGEIASRYSRGSSAGGVVRMEEDGVVRIHLTYFPGWQVRINGKPVAHRISPPHGLLEVNVPAGEHRIDVRMGSTPIRRTGMMISYGALILTLGLLFWPQKR
jgi:hypothetical protein